MKPHISTAVLASAVAAHLLRASSNRGATPVQPWIAIGLEREYVSAICWCKRDCANHSPRLIPCPHHFPLATPPLKPDNLPNVRPSRDLFPNHRRSAQDA